MTARGPVVQRCRFCGCTAERTCALPHGDECAFLNARADRCSAPACVRAFEDERDRAACRDAQHRAMVRQLRERKTRRRSFRKAA